MSSVAIVTDSVASLPHEMLCRYGIHVIPVRIAVAGKVYRDTEQDLPVSLIRELQGAQSIDTTPWPPQHYCHEYERIAATASEIIHIVPFARFTSTISLAKAGAVTAQERVPGLRVEVVDSMATAMAQGLVALEAARLASMGRGMDEILSSVEQAKSGVGGAYTFDSLRPLARTGRINALASWAGSVLSVAPVIGLWDGREHRLGLARSRSQAIMKVTEAVCRRLDGKECSHIAVEEAGRYCDAEKLLDAIQQRVHAVESIIVRVSPVTQIVAGPGLLGVSYCRRQSSS